MKYINILFLKKLNILFIYDFVPISITFGIYLQELLDGASMKNLVLPIAIYIGWFFIYLLISSIELYFAIQIIKENNLKIENKKKNVFTSIIRKSLENIVIGVLIFTLMSICLLSEVSKGSHEKDSQGFGYLTVLGILVFFSLSSIIYKGVKIGESFEKIEGEKDEFFNLIGAGFLILKKWFFNRTINSFNINPQNEEKVNNKENGKIN